MNEKLKLKEMLIKLDKYSPVPFLFPFVMTNSEKALFDKTIKHSRVYLEFGMGGSTFRTLQKSKAKIYSIDSSTDWINFMHGYWIIKTQERKRLKLFYVNIGMTKEWGIPSGNDSRELFPNYSQNIFNLVDKKTVDTVLIDGRFRVACTLKTILECSENDNLHILIHDFWNRDKYHIVLKYLTELERVDTLGLFSIKENVDLNSVLLDYELFKYNHD